LDLDGRQDLVTANVGTGKVTVFRNESPVSGGTSFEGGIDFSSGANTHAQWVAVRDLDADGRHDLVVANWATGSISALRNITAPGGQITFSSPVSVPAGPNPNFVTTGDFDNDGRYDVAVSNSGSGRVRLLRNVSVGVGDITFTDGPELVVTGTTMSIAVDDFNADGKLDLAVTNRLGTAVSVFKNTTEANVMTFGSKVDFTVNPQPHFVASQDLDGDHKPDLAVTTNLGGLGTVSVLRNTSGGSDISFAASANFPLMDGPQFSGGPGHLVAGDTNGDGRIDLIALNGSVRSALVLQNSSTKAGAVTFLPRIETPISQSGALAVGDFGDDGRQDIAFAGAWPNNVGLLENTCSPVGSSPFDFDGDSKTDIGIFRPSVGEWWVYRSLTGSVFAAQFGVSTDKIAPADFTGDGKTDVAFWRPATGEWVILRSEDLTYYSGPFGTAGDIPVPADYDADGKADVAVFRPSSGFWFVQRSSDNATTAQQFGTSGDQPVAADYDGAGRADVGIFRPSVGEWWIYRSTAGVIAYTFGTSSDKTVPGDYTGDGKSDVAFWRPSTGEWVILRSEDTTYYSAPFGSITDFPTPGDYDGDGKHDLAVYRPAAGTWFVNQTSGGSIAHRFGASTDQPIPGAFVR
jgi:hypothetical protein